MKRKVIISIVIGLIVIGISGAVIFAIKGTDSIERKFETGYKYLEDGKYEEAILAFEAILEIDEANIEARVGIATAYIELKEYEKAEEYIREAIDLDETMAELWEILIKIYEETNKSKEEIKDLYFEAYDKTDDERFKDWIEAHTPKKPKVNFKSGDYEEVLYVELTNQDKDSETTFTLDGTIPNENSTLYTEAIRIDEGDTTLTIAVVNDWGLTRRAKYSYHIEIPIIPIQFEDSALERMLKDVLGKEENEILYSDELDEIIEVEITGPYIYIEKNDGSTLGLNVNSINKEKYWISDDVQTSEVGDLITINDFLKFRSLKSLSIRYQPNIELNNVDQLKQIDKLSFGGIDIDQIILSKITKLNQLTKLNLWLNNISDIQVLSDMTQLTFLGVWDNELTDISPIANMQQLTYLSMGGNNISNIDVLKKIDTIESINLWENNIVDITALSHMKQLRFLSLHKNKISDVGPLSKLTQLEQLFIYDNPITDYTPLDNLTDTEISMD